ncbi:MAG: glutathione S-transferase family protein [Gammaproteobacteria bacterium]|nr:glutathione S-transferase family protein [Gammaproteobacteria bacterium]
MRKLYGSIVSPFVRKVWIFLSLKNIQFELENLVPFIPEHKEKILTMNPLGKIPIYQEDDFIISDTSVICAYLEKQYPNQAIYPSDAKEYAQCLWYEEYADTILMPAILTIFFNICLAERFGKNIDHDAVKTIFEKQLPEIFTYLDREIANKKYFVGDRLSLADIAVAAPFLNLEFAAHTIDSAKWKNLSRYLNYILNEKVICQANLLAKERFYKK